MYCVDAELNAFGHNITSNGIIEQKEVLKLMEKLKSVFQNL